MSNTLNKESKDGVKYNGKDFEAVINNKTYVFDTPLDFKGRMDFFIKEGVMFVRFNGKEFKGRIKS